MDINKQIGNNIRVLRKRSGLTQARLAAKLYVHHSTVQKWESGENGVGPENQADLCKIFGLSRWELMADEISFDNIIYSDRYKRVQECINRFVAYNDECGSFKYQIRYSGDKIHSIYYPPLKDDMRAIKECIKKGIVASEEEYCFFYKSQDYILVDSNLLERLCTFLYYKPSFNPDAFALTGIVPIGTIGDDGNIIDDEPCNLDFLFESDGRCFSICYYPSILDDFQIVYEVCEYPWIGTTSEYAETIDEALQNGIPYLWMDDEINSNLKILDDNGIIHKGQTINWPRYIELEKQYKDLLPKLCIKEHDDSET